MKNIDDECEELKFEDITLKVEKYLNVINEERKKLDAFITQYQKAIIDAGMEIAKIHYRKKKYVDEYGDKRWYKWS